MFQKHFVTRILPTSVCGLAIFLAASPARSERLGDERACVSAFKKAREHEQGGKLQEAKELLMSCAQAPCGNFLRQQCASKYNQLEVDTPSVVLMVTDTSGSPRADVQVRMDGEVFAQQLDGRALTVDPGMHEFSFSSDGNVFATQKIMILQGQRNRFVTAIAHGGKQRRMIAVQPEGPVPSRKIASAASGSEESPANVTAVTATTSPITETPAGDDGDKADERPKKSRSVLPYVIGGVGLASVGAGALLTYWGRKDNDRLGQCSPTCPTASTNHIKRLYLMSDVAFGVGVAALGAAYWVYVVTHSNKEEKAAEEALRLDVVPTTSGGFAAVSGSF